MVRHLDTHDVWCSEEEGEAFYTVSYAPEYLSDVVVEKLPNFGIKEIHYETVTLTDKVSVTVCAKSEEDALEKAAKIFGEFFEKMAKKVPEAIYRELNDREKWFFASFIPSHNSLNLTCVREVPVKYNPNLVYTDEELEVTRYFTFVQAGDVDTAKTRGYEKIKDYLCGAVDRLNLCFNKEK